MNDFIRGLTAARALPFDAGRVVSIFARDSAGQAAGPIPYSRYLSAKSRADLFEWVGAAAVAQRSVVLGGASTAMSVAFVAPEVARLLGLRVDKGAVLRHGFAAEAVGATIAVNGREYPVSGAAPEAVQGLYDGRPVDLWLLLSGEPPPRAVWVLARLRADVAPERAAAEMDLPVVPYTGAAPGTTEGLRRAGTLLRIAAALVLFIACANVAAFQLARAARRAHETSIRVAVGASRVQVARTPLSDAIIVALAGGAVGVVVASWTSRVLPAFLFEEDARSFLIAGNLADSVATGAIVLAVIVACGLSPMLDSPHARPADVLRLGSLGVSKGVRMLRAGLVGCQMACCCLLVFSAGYLGNGLKTALRTTVSRRLGNPLLASVSTSPAAGLSYFAGIEAAARSVPGIAPLAWAARLPGNRPAWQSFRIEPRGLPLRDVRLGVEFIQPASVSRFALPPEAGRMFRLVDQGCPTAVVNRTAAAALFGDATVGRALHDAAGSTVVILGVVALKKPSAGASPAIYYDATNRSRSQSAPGGTGVYRVALDAPLETVEFDANVVSPEYFAAAGFPVVAGRTFPDDPQARRCRVAVVNEDAAPYFGGDPVGAAVIDDAGQRTEIIGVVRSAQLGAFERRAAPAIYLPMAQDYVPRMTIVLAAAGDTRKLAETVRRALEPVPGAGPDPMIVRTLEQYLDQTSLAPLRIAVLTMRASAALGLALSVLGLYGTLSDAVRRRYREMAIRIALGARHRDIVARVLRDGARLAGPGAVAGLAASVLLSRLLSHVAQTAAPPPLWVWAAGPAAIAAAVAAASIVPVRRSVLADPATLLRDS